MRSAWNEFQVTEGARRDPVGSVESGVQDHFQGRPRKFAAGAAPTWPEESSFDELTDRLEDASSCDDTKEFSLAYDPLGVINDDIDGWFSRSHEQEASTKGGGPHPSAPSDAKACTVSSTCQETIERRCQPVLVARAVVPQLLGSPGSRMPPAGGAAYASCLGAAGLLCAAPAADAWTSTNGSGVLVSGSGIAASPAPSCVTAYAHGQPMRTPVTGSACAAAVESLRRSPTEFWDSTAAVSLQSLSASNSLNQVGGLNIPPKDYKRVCQEYRCKRCGAPKKGHICTAPREGGRPLGVCVVRKEWSQIEDDFLITSVAKYGGRWRAIASVLPERTEDSVRARVL